MIFAQYRNAITFALVIVALALVVADPGAGDSANEPAPAEEGGSAALAAAPVPAANAVHVSAGPATSAPVDPSWYGDAGAQTPGIEDQMTGTGPATDDGYNLAPARSVPARNTAARPAPAPAPQRAEYIPPPPPPQLPPGR